MPPVEFLTFGYASLRPRIAGGVLAAVLLAATGGAAAQDPERGKQLYETHCGACHYDRLHKRDRSRSIVHTLADLRVQVARWARETKRPFTDDELDDVAAHLNRIHYRLEK